MRILYRILDWCQQNQADVFLQQMWSNVGWNAFPEWRNDPVKRVHSGPLSMTDFGEGLATLVEHLVKTKGYTCIHWVCINNEPNGQWSWWQRPPNQLLPLKPGLAAVRKALDAHGLSLPLSGPDLTGGVPDFDPTRFDFHELLGAYDFHSYDENFDWLKPQGGMARLDRNTTAWTTWAHKQGKPFFMSEFGTMANGWGADHPGPASFASVLKDCELVVRRLNSGVDGFNRWSFLNRGDLDGQWQFLETWDRKNKKMLATYTPQANTYFALGLLSRFTAKHSAVLATTVEGGKLEGWPRSVCRRSAKSSGKPDPGGCQRRADGPGGIGEHAGIGARKRVLPLRRDGGAARSLRSAHRPAKIVTAGTRRDPSRSAGATKRDRVFHLPPCSR